MVIYDDITPLTGHAGCPQVQTVSVAWPACGRQHGLHLQHAGLALACVVDLQPGLSPFDPIDPINAVDDANASRKGRYGSPMPARALLVPVATTRLGSTDRACCNK
jgi:hypothetical protein